MNAFLTKLNIISLTTIVVIVAVGFHQTAETQNTNFEAPPMIKWAGKRFLKDKPSCWLMNWIHKQFNYVSDYKTEALK